MDDKNKTRVYVCHVKPFTHEEYDQDANSNQIQNCLENRYVCIGWGATGDISKLKNRNDLSDRIINTHQIYIDPKNELSNETMRRKLAVGTGALWKLSKEMKVGDFILMPNGQDVYIGRVSGDYYYEPNVENAKIYDGYTNHRIKVNWFNKPFKRGNMPTGIENGLSNRQVVVTVAYEGNENEKHIIDYLKGLEEYAKVQEDIVKILDVSITARIMVNEKIITLNGLPTTIKNSTIEKICSELKHIYQSNLLATIG